MAISTEAHYSRGLHRILDRAGIYNAFQRLLLRPGSRARYVREFIRPFPGSRILDIGCGPGDILEFLPESIGRYDGFDMNPDYITAARRRWGGRGQFHCAKVETVAPDRMAAYDIVLANGILHHLNDQEAQHLFRVAVDSLGSGGVLVTYDNVYIEDQHWFARWLIGRDRGQAVRTQDGYEVLARSAFGRVDSTILHDTLRVPYTILIMRCAQAQ